MIWKAFLLRLMIFSVLAAAACTAPARIERIDPGRPVYVLAGADEALDRTIANEERTGPGEDPSALVSLRLTRDAKDLIGAGETDRALDLLERAIEQNGNQGFSYLYIAHLYIESGDVPQGLIFLDRAEALLPGTRNVQSAVTNMLSRASEVAAAREQGE